MEEIVQGWNEKDIVEKESYFIKIQRKIDTDWTSQKTGLIVREKEASEVDWRIYKENQGKELEKKCECSLRKIEVETSLE